MEKCTRNCVRVDRDRGEKVYRRRGKRWFVSRRFVASERFVRVFGDHFGVFGTDSGRDEKKPKRYRWRVSILIRTSLGERGTIRLARSCERFSARAIFEEFIFRGAVLAVLLGGVRGVGVQRAVLLSPLFFGLAHVNHYFALKKIYGRGRALCAVLFQFSYTTAFGVLAGVVFWRCKAGLAGAWSLHASANAFGAPDFRPFRTSGGLFTSNVLEKMCYVLGLVSAFAFVRSSVVA